MDGNTTVKYLQHYLRQKDLGFLALDSLPPGPQREAQEERLKHNFFLKDVLYYTLCLAEAYGIDMEEAIREKERLNNLRFHDEHPFEAGR